MKKSKTARVKESADAAVPEESPLSEQKQEERQPEVVEEIPASEPSGAEEMEALKAKADEHWDRLLRVTAEFENFRKRAAREKEEALRYANLKLIERLLPVLDSFDMAITAADAPKADASDALREGIQMVFQQFRSALSEAGLEEIDAKGQPFDPNLHEAVSQLETDKVQEGHVVQQLRKGYRLRDRLVRPSSVVVAKKPGA